MRSLRGSELRRSCVGACRYCGEALASHLQPNSALHLKQTGARPMFKSLAILGALAFAATSNAALAQQGGQPPPASLDFHGSESR
jgi:hypothetical protein